LQREQGYKKRVYPHLFRHSAATRLAKHLTDSEMKAFLGWTQGSSMAATYVHLAGEDTDPAVFRMYGIKTPELTKSELAVSRCPRCKELNPEKSFYCGKCGLPLTENEAARLKTDTSDTNFDAFKILKEDSALAKTLESLLRNLKK
jgi:integrase/recombinase XerD